MKRRIAAVLMVDVAGMSRALAADERLAAARLDESRTLIRDVVARGGGRMLARARDPSVAEFQSAVEAVRAAVDVQESLRPRNRTLPLAERLEYKLAITIGDVTADPAADGEVAASEETFADGVRLLALATPGGICISRSVREAVASKLKLKVLDLTVEGEPPDSDTEATYRVATGKPATGAARTRLPQSLASRLTTPVVAGSTGLFLAAAVVAVIALGPAGTTGGTTGGDEPHAAALLPPQPAAAPVVAAPAAVPSPATKPKSAPGGVLEFKPAYAPDPAAVLTARRLLPNAWRDCQATNPDVAVKACKTLLDSGIAKSGELAQIHVWNGKALRARNESDKAIDSLNVALGLKPTPAAFSLRGNIHYENGRWEPAIADYTEAIRLEAGNGEAYNNRAWTYYKSGRHREALADAHQAVRLLAKQAYVWDTRGHVHAALGDREAAIRDFRAALAIDPKHAEARAGLTRLGVN